MTQFKDEYHQMNGFVNPGPTERSSTSTSGTTPRIINPHAHHRRVPPLPHLPENSYSQWTTRGRDMDFASRERIDDDIRSSRWRYPFDEASSRYSTSLEDYYHTPPCHYRSTHVSSGHTFHHAPGHTTAPLPGNEYPVARRGTDIFRPPVRDSYSTPRAMHTTAASSSPQMVTPTRALNPEGTSTKSSGFMFPHSPSSQNNPHGPDVESRRSFQTKDRATSSSMSSHLIWHLEEIDIVCGRGAPSLFQRGNQTFRDLIQEHQTVYLCSKRSDKPRLAWKIFDIVTSRGGRFVRRNKVHNQNHHHSRPTDTGDGGVDDEPSPSSFAWEQLTDRQAYEKICQSLREGAPELRRRLFLDVKQQRGQQRKETDEEYGEDVGEKNVTWALPSSPPEEDRKDQTEDLSVADKDAAYSI